MQGEGANVPAGISMCSRSENAILAIEPCFEDRRITRSKKALRGALIFLMEEKGFDSITVNDLCSARFIKRPLPFLVDLFEYLSKQGAFLHAVLGPGGDIRFGPRLRDSVCAHLIQSVLHEQYRNDPSAFVDYYLAFYASAYLGVITHWIETGMKESSEEMALIAMRLLFIRPGEPIRM